MDTIALKVLVLLLRVQSVRAHRVCVCVCVCVCLLPKGLIRLKRLPSFYTSFIGLILAHKSRRNITLYQNKRPVDAKQVCDFRTGPIVS